MNRILMITALLLAGCADKTVPRHVVDAVEVNVPVLERAEAPKELYRAPVARADLPRWVLPADPSATVCLPKMGEPLLKRLILNRESLLEGWEAYGR